MAAQSRINARFSTYSGAPSIQPSLAPTFETSTTRNPSQRNTQTSQHLSEQAAYANSGFYAQNPATAAASSTTLSNSTDPKTADIKSWSAGFERMQDERLDKQRYVMNENKSDEVSKLALGAKLERALGRRMVGQDASFSRSKKDLQSEKAGLEVEVN